MRDNTKDISGRPYANVLETKTGSVVRADVGFDCLKADGAYTVEGGPGGLFVRCSDGKHYLEGQISDDETAYVGLYPT